MTVLAALLVIALALVHLFAGRLRLVGNLSRSTWLSAAGGVAVAYVFLHLMPDLAARQQRLGPGAGLGAEGAERLVFLFALAGLIVFYGLERLALVSTGRAGPAPGVAAGNGLVFCVHVGAFSLYNILIGYLLVRGERDVAAALAYAFAMAMHFLAIDASLRRHHRERYDRVGRWIVSAAVLAGGALAGLARLPDLALSLMFAFLAGGIVLNVLKEELPEERQARLMPFILGAALYSGVLAFV